MLHLTSLAGSWRSYTRPDFPARARRAPGAGTADYCDAALNRFTRPNPNVVSRPGAPRSSTAASSLDRIVDAVAVGYLSQMIAVAPATCGVAIEVPDSVVYDVSLEL